MGIQLFKARPGAGAILNDLFRASGRQSGSFSSTSIWICRRLLLDFRMAGCRIAGRSPGTPECAFKALDLFLGDFR
jgi:hypothetical protein